MGSQRVGHDWETSLSFTTGRKKTKHSLKQKVTQNYWKDFCKKWKFSLDYDTEVNVAQSLRPHGLYSPWNSPGQNTGVGSLSFLLGIFPTQGLNPGFPHCRQTLYQLSHKGSPRILEWVAYPFSRGTSHPRNWTGVSCIAGRFFANWAMTEICCLNLFIKILEFKDNFFHQ